MFKGKVKVDEHTEEKKRKRDRRKERGEEKIEDQLTRRKKRDDLMFYGKVKVEGINLRENKKQFYL